MTGRRVGSDWMAVDSDQDRISGADFVSFIVAAADRVVEERGIQRLRLAGNHGRGELSNDDRRRSAS